MYLIGVWLLTGPSWRRRDWREFLPSPHLVEPYPACGPPAACRARMAAARPTQPTRRSSTPNGMWQLRNEASVRAEVLGPPMRGDTLSSSQAASTTPIHHSDVLCTPSHACECRLQRATFRSTAAARHSSAPKHQRVQRRQLHDMQTGLDISRPPLPSEPPHHYSSL